MNFALEDIIIIMKIINAKTMKKNQSLKSIKNKIKYKFIPFTSNN